jgi:hypothetical protein
MRITRDHFEPDPAHLESARARFVAPIAGATGAQGMIVACDDVLHGLVAKLYHPQHPRSSADLQRAQALIRMCRSLSPHSPASTEWFDRLNLPVRPIVNGAGAFCGVFLPPIPPSVFAPEYAFDPKTGQLEPTGSKITFEAQYLVSERSVIGVASAKRRWRVLHSLAETVAMMHSANLVHGDLSLSNVLVQSRSAEGLTDDVYLIDVDDAILDAPDSPAPARVRQSRSMYDPASIEARRIDKRTDVFVVALWTIAFVRGHIDPPFSRAFGPGVDHAVAEIARIDRACAEIVARALGDIARRPAAEEMYDAIRRVARRWKVA